MICSLKAPSIRQRKEAILTDIDFQIEKGEFVYLIGKTGSGKSSILKVLYGDLPLEEGQGEVAGFDLKKIKESQIPYLRRKIGIIFQDFQLLTDRNVYDNMYFALRATGWKDKRKINERIDQVLKYVDMQHKQHKFTYKLSGGEQQRVVIARALLNNPELIIADEPTGNLDPNTSVEIMKILLDINKKEKTAVLMATHDYPLIIKYPRRTLKIEDETILEVENNVSGN